MFETFCYITLKPNKNSVPYTSKHGKLAGEKSYEAIDICAGHPDALTAFGVVHVDTFYSNNGDENEIYERLVKGETVRAKLVSIS